jgi:hypothetical protein
LEGDGESVMGLLGSFLFNYMEKYLKKYYKKIGYRSVSKKVFIMYNIFIDRIVIYIL